MTTTLCSYICPTCGGIREIDIGRVDFDKVLACRDCGCLFFLNIPPANVSKDDILVARLVKEGKLLRRNK
jgi:hypothetical protein